MKQTIEIEVPDGKKAVWKDGRVIFENINPHSPKTWKEFCENHDTKKEEHYIDDSCNLVAAIGGYKRDVQKDRNLLPSKQAAEAHLDHTPENCSDDNLKALCQRCHNQYDAEHRKQTRKGKVSAKQ